MDSQGQRSKKRFIAGAVCPRCSEMDKIVMYKLDGKDYRECVACDFKDEMHFKPAHRELDTRVNLSEEKLAEETQVIRLVTKNSGPSKSGPSQT